MGCGVIAPMSDSAPERAVALAALSRADALIEAVLLVAQHLDRDHHALANVEGLRGRGPTGGRQLSVSGEEMRAAGGADEVS